MEQQPATISWDYAEFPNWGEQQQQELKDWMKALLTSDQEITVTFTKADGTLRELRGTLNESIGAKYIVTENKENKENKKHNADICVVYDLDKDAWRSFRWDRLTNVKYTIG